MRFIVTVLELWGRDFVIDAESELKAREIVFNRLKEEIDLPEKGYIQGTSPVMWPTISLSSTRIKRHFNYEREQDDE